MKNILGFRDDIEAGAGTDNMLDREANNKQVGVRSLVQVRFSGYAPLTYYNEKFDLHEGDLVYVSGRLKGRIGTVETVSTKFRIRKSDYEKVLHQLDMSIHGTYVPGGKDYMISTDSDAVSPEQFRSWVEEPPSPDRKTWYIDSETGIRTGYLETDQDDEIITGEGYELSLHSLESAEDLTDKILERAKAYRKENRVKYLSLQNGAGVSWVRGGDWYELQFNLSGDEITDLYCSCPYPGLCKHAIASLMVLRELRGLPDMEDCSDFSAVENDYFWSILRQRRKPITI